MNRFFRRVSRSLAAEASTDRMASSTVVLRIPYDAIKGNRDPL
jgi:hypothetical protein